MLKNCFDATVATELIGRINQLTPDTKPLWGKMSADQVLAHLNVAYLYTYQAEKFPKPGAFKRFLLRAFVKQLIVSPKPYPRSGRTAPEFVIVGQRDFAKEKAELIAHIEKTQQLGEAYFEGKENRNFGRMTAAEWNILFYKHLDHHLTQFGI